QGRRGCGSANVDGLQTAQIELVSFGRMDQGSGHGGNQATGAHSDTFVRSVREVVDLVHSSGSFWSEALQLAARAVNI
ncbi:MAG: hypothetical protein LAP21_00665, partial [Acidobacteriia bacterium]|nr:hypothetical protein [Terriglobia bacterium]